MVLRELWDRNRPTLGAWCTVPGGFGAEMLGHCGFDWVCIDAQHGVIGYEQMLAMLQGLAVTHTPAFVRVSWNDPGEIMKALDAGAQGVIVPMVNSAEEARLAVAACKYPPLGLRSYGPTRIALGRPDFDPKTANLESLCVVMVETVEALERLDDIAAVPGVDAVFVGPSDLAISIGVPPTYAVSDERHHREIERVLRACQARGVVAGIYCGNAAMTQYWRSKGFQMLAVTSEATLLMQAAETMLAELRDNE